MEDVVPEVEVDPTEVVASCDFVEADGAAPLSLAATRASKPTTAMAPARATPVVELVEAPGRPVPGREIEGCGSLGVHAASLGGRPFRSGYDGRVASSFGSASARGQLDRQAGAPQVALADVPAAAASRGRSRRRSRAPDPRPTPRRSPGGSGRRSVALGHGRDPGPASSTARSTRPDSPPRRPAPGSRRGELAGVVDEDAEEPVEPLRRDRHDVSPGAAGRVSVRPRASATTPNRSAAGRAITPRSTGSASGRPAQGVEAGEPEEVLEDPPDPLALAVDPLEGAPVGLGHRGRRRGPGCLGLDHRDRRAQLVRGVGAEGELALARPLDRRGDAPPDRDRPQEHEDEQDRRR